MRSLFEITIRSVPLASTTLIRSTVISPRFCGFEVARDRYTLPRWEAKRWSIDVEGEGTGFKAPVTSYFPYSGQTSPTGVIGEIVYAGRSPKFSLDGLKGKVALVDFETNTREWA